MINYNLLLRQKIKKNIIFICYSKNIYKLSYGKSISEWNMCFMSKNNENKKT